MKIFFISFLFITSFAFAQTPISGQVQNEKGEPIELANVLLYDQNDQVLGYAITDENGSFELAGNFSDKQRLITSFVGCFSDTLFIRNLDLSSNLKITLHPDNSLEAIELVYDLPVRINGDTISYKTDAFTNGNEEVLGDVLENLPGVTIEEDGKVKVDGKEVGKVLIEGKEFFGGNVSLATKNIPADALDKVEVVRNYDDVSLLKNVRNNQDNIAINIKLKEGKKKFWFGDITAKAGFENRYGGKANLFYYHPKYSLNFIGNSNNIKEEVINFNNYIQLIGGFEKLMEDGIDFETDAIIRSLLTENPNLYNKNNHFGAANFTRELNKNLSFSSMALWNYSRPQYQSAFNRWFQDNNGKKHLLENGKNLSEDKNSIGKIQAKWKYLPSSRTQWDFSLNADHSSVNQIQNNYSSLNGKQKTVSNLDNNSISGDITGYFKLNEKFVIQSKAVARIASGKIDENYFISQSDRFSFNDLLSVDTNRAFDFNFENQVTDNQFGLSMKSWYLIKKGHQLNFTAANSLKSEYKEGDIFQDGVLLSNQEEITRKTNNLLGGLTYQFRGEKWLITAGVSKNYVRMSINDSVITTSPWIKNLGLKYSFSNEHSVAVNYNEKVRMPELNNHWEAFRWNTNQIINKGSSTLSPATDKNVELLYNRFSLFDAYSVFGSIRYTRTSNPFIEVNTPVGAESGQELSYIRSIENSDENNEAFSASFQANKTFGKIKIDINGQYQLTNSPFYFSDRLTESISDMRNIGVAVKSIFKGKYNFKLGYRLAQNKFENANLNSLLRTHSPSLTVYYRLNKKIRFESKIQNNISFNKEDRLNENWIWDASINYRWKDSKWNIIAEGKNLLNQKELVNNGSNSLFVNETVFSLFPRRVVLGVRYKL
jgi:hypothetical protein